MPSSIYLLNEHYTELASKSMIAIAITELIAAIGSMYIANMNRNAFARNSHHDRVDNEENNRHVCIVQKHYLLIRDMYALTRNIDLVTIHKKK